MLHSGEWLVKKYATFTQPRANQSLDTTLITLASRLQDVRQRNDEKNPNAVPSNAPPLPPLSDRRAAILTLKGLARDHPAEVGAKAFDAILESLCRDAKVDDEIARAIVETCLTLCDLGNHQASSTILPAKTPMTTITHAGKETVLPVFVVQHVERFLSTSGPLHALLPLLSPSRSFYTRFSALQLLGSLLRVRAERVQEHVLTSPGGCGAILECLSDNNGSSSEIVRNEALLLLPELVAGNADIQKLIAFEGAFEKLIDVVAVEGRIEGGVVVQDALEALVALLKYNVSNQNYFRETLSIPLLAPLLFYPPPPPSNDPQAEHEYFGQLEAFTFQQWYPPVPAADEDDGRQHQNTNANNSNSNSSNNNSNDASGLDEQKVINASLVIEVAGLLIEGQGESKRLNQNALLSCGFTKCLTEVALACTAPISLRSQALRVVAALLQSSRSNQELLNTLNVSPIARVGRERKAGTYDDANSMDFDYTRLPERPAILELVGATINGAASGVSEVESLTYRAAALGCFDAYVNDNLDARLNIIKAMAPPADKLSQDTSIIAGSGTLILQGVSQFPSISGTHTANGGQSFDAYQYLLSALLFANLIRGSETAKSLARGLLFGGDGKVIAYVDAENKPADANDDDDNDDERITLLQVLIGNLTMALREHGEATRRERGAGSGTKGQIHGGAGSPTDWTRVQVGYLIVLVTWLWQSPAAVVELLKESSNLQALIQPVSQGGNMIDPIVSGLCAVALGIVYEFGPSGGRATASPQNDNGAQEEAKQDDDGAVTRETIHPILHSRIGPDQFAARLTRLRDDARFKNTGPDILETIRQNVKSEAQRPHAIGGLTGSLGKEELDGGVWFDWAFVDFLKTNYVVIQRSILVEPSTTSATEASQSTELLDAKRQLEQVKEAHVKAMRDVEFLRQQLIEESDGQRAEREALLESVKQAKDESAKWYADLQALQQKTSEQSVPMDRQASNAETESAAAHELSELRRRLQDVENARAEESRQRSTLEEQLMIAQRQRDEAERSARQAQFDAEAARAEAERAVTAAHTTFPNRTSETEHADSLFSSAVDDASGQRFGSIGEESGPSGGASAADAEGAKSKAEVEKELEDLLILLDELSTKRKTDKKRMREYGMDVSEDEDDEEEDDILASFA